MSGKTVLLVEDDPDTRLIYRTMLEREGYRVIQARDGSEGVALAREHVPDLIVMNLVMPELDGLSAVELIRAEQSTSAVPIIVCTAFVREDGADMAESAGCNGYLEKPCEPTRLVDEVKRFLGDIEADTVVPAGGV